MHNLTANGKNQCIFCKKSSSFNIRKDSELFIIYHNKISYQNIIVSAKSLEFSSIQFNSCFPVAWRERRYHLVEGG